jgi:hypothetical protein
MGRSEILKLPWLDMDIAHNRILPPQTKNGEGPFVYLNKGAASTLRGLPFGPETKATDKLFPDLSPEQVRIAFTRACRQFALLDFHFRDLRRTAAEVPGC